jgi:hypothetical protein
MSAPFCGRRTKRHGDAGTLPDGKVKLASASGRALPPFPPDADAAPVPPPKAKGAAMNDHALRTIAAVEELAAELAHADALVAEQQARIGFLEQLVVDLQAIVARHEAAA